MWNILISQETKGRIKKIDKYKKILVDWISENRDMSTAQIYDWIRERYGEVDFKDRTLGL